MRQFKSKRQYSLKWQEKSTEKNISGSGVGRDEAYERAERGLQERSQRSGVGHGIHFEIIWSFSQLVNLYLFLHQPVYGLLSCLTCEECLLSSHDKWICSPFRSSGHVDHDTVETSDQQEPVNTQYKEI